MSYTFSKSDGGPISKAEAESWIDNYKTAHPSGPWAVFFGEDIINEVLSDPNAVGMRIYLGYDDNENLKMILVGAKADGSNIWPDDTSSSGVALKTKKSTAGDQGMVCPPYCP